MPRWRELPEELDPQVREFVRQLRRLVEHSELSLVVVADRTGYSKTSWERYLNGRLLPPQGAVVALAEATGTDVEHLSTLWELAERAWSRSELRHDVTMEAIRVAQARAALGDTGPLPHSRNGRTPEEAEAGWAHTEPPRTESPRTEPPGAEPPHTPGTAVRRAAAVPPVRPVPPVADPPLVSVAPALLPDPPGPPGPPGPPEPPERPDPPGPPTPPDRRRRRVPLFIATAVGVLLMGAAAVLLVNPGGQADERAKDPTPGRTTTSGPRLPSGVKCTGQECTGKDPEAMGCGGAYARTTASVTVGSAYAEVRYSKVCGAAWARITKAAPGDRLQVTAPAQGAVGPARTEYGKVNADGDAYTPMIAVGSITQAKACATRTTGQRGCTTTAAGRTSAP
ncbi:helix-turn-helix domain-containing protein [Streptomyces milbemycinicus]|uniref:Helix-turn-helix domain-containing protein n=1 Tax=Streptomyces milbemycinicus TaxID=476552 RepID=A0ABW8LSX7_9ACTN